MNEDVTYVVKCIPPLPKEKRKKKKTMDWMINCVHEWNGHMNVKFKG
jgi:hypothetical protein